MSVVAVACTVVEPEAVTDAVNRTVPGYEDGQVALRVVVSTLPFPSVVGAVAVPAKEESAEQVAVCDLAMFNCSLTSCVAVVTVELDDENLRPVISIGRNATAMSARITIATTISTRDTPSSRVNACLTFPPNVISLPVAP